MSVKPNFFIVGAPKCGTTALYEYLRSHPNILMPEVKEPHFFATDLGAYPSVKTLEDYTKLFEEATPKHLRIGEASVHYLASSVAIAKIRQFNPDAKIIAMLRNPVDMVYSLHSELLDWSIETVSSFEAAWRMQERRRQGLDLPRGISAPLLVQYEQMGRFGTQVERLLSIFPRERVKLILYDDFAVSPQRVYDEVIDFLDLPHDGRTDFPRVNENRTVRLPWLRTFYRKPPPVLRSAFRGLKRTVGGPGIVAVKEKIVALNTLRERRTPLSPEFRAEMVKAFHGEVMLLSRILNRDLGHWS